MKKMKIVVIGPHQAGKSTLIRRLDPWAVRMDYSKGTFSTTVGFDYGIVLWDATENRIYRRDQIDSVDPSNEIWKVTITGTPGQIAFSGARKALLRGKDGVILLIDATQPAHLVYAMEQYQEAREVLGSGFPLVIFSNKHDLPIAKDSKQMMPLLGIRADVWEISALRGNNVERAFKSFLEKLRRYLILESVTEIVGRRWL